VRSARGSVHHGAVRTPNAWVVGGAAVAITVVSAACVDAAGSSSHPSPAETFDAIVVLGCRVGPSGRASPALARRALHGARLWREGRAPRLVLTGGVGDHPPSEAQVAADLALGAGVPASALSLEERSTSTAENARFARPLVQGERVLVVTDGFHGLRAARIFRRHFGTVALSTVTAGPLVRARGALRELPLHVLDLLRG